MSQLWLVNVLWNSKNGMVWQVLNGFFEDGKLVQPQEARPGPRTALGV